MGTILRRMRALVANELTWLQQIASEPLSCQWFDAHPAELSAARMAIEFELHLDQIAELPVVGGAPNDRQGFLLEFLPGVSLAFEKCFMDHSVVEGSFPTRRVQIAFALRPGDATEKNVLPWPVSYRWIGDPCRPVMITAARFPNSADTLPLFRFAVLQGLTERNAG